MVQPAVSGHVDQVAKRKTPRERFRFVAPKRTQKVLDALSLLERCGKSLTYEYEDAEIEKIFVVIRDAVERAYECFGENEEPEKVVFQL